MAANDPVLERIATYAWPRGGVQARRVRGGYTRHRHARARLWPG